MKAFDIPAVNESASASRGGRVFRKASDMVPSTPFDYSCPEMGSGCRLY